MERKVKQRRAVGNRWSKQIHRFLWAPLYIHNSASQISRRPRCTSAQYSLLVTKSCRSRRQRFYSVKPRAYETQINPLCDDPARQLTSPTAHGEQEPTGSFIYLFIDIAYKCSLCLNCLQKLNGVCKSPSNIPTCACEFLPGRAGTEATEQSRWW